eukprot:gnl/TRDRNA2_/TRDRNA2_95041_c0_seq1.p1 gnl/TRDRNA2_/TRDRNA2_95041_c0~~gnl/TRDRNA2_/TRDRNA2_95041_c0_seq1.p1  ORF type:complete len:308 (+),score=26.43 gnl/TRDRNA2_/TRDRNA2_95041_c0_seq1:109-1032(+)
MPPKPSWSEGCSGLPSWPSTGQLKTAGFGEGVPWESAAFGLLFSAGACVPSLLQAINFLRCRSVHGVSLLMVFLNMLTCSLQLAVSLATTGTTFYICPPLGISSCLAASMATLQFALQLVGPQCLFVLYMHIWRRESIAAANGDDVRLGDASLATVANSADSLMCNAELSQVTNAKPSIRRRSGCAWWGFVMALATMAASAALPSCVGPCSSKIKVVSDFVGAAATISTSCGLLPQMALLCRTRDRGTLSIGMLLVQAIGNLAQVVNFFFERAPPAAILPFAVLSLESSIVLFMIAYYGHCVNRRAR